MLPVIKKICHLLKYYNLKVENISAYLETQTTDQEITEPVEPQDIVNTNKVGNAGNQTKNTKPVKNNKR